MQIPTWLKKHVLAMDYLVFREQRQEYVVVSSKLAEQVGAPGVFTIRLEDVLAVSDKYPKEYRELGLIHELIEHDSEPLTEHSCRAALQQELSLANDAGLLTADYIAFRQTFFADLMNFYEAKERSPDEELLLARLKHSLEYLEALVV